MMNLYRYDLWCDLSQNFASLNVYKIYTSENIYLKEIATTQNIKLSKPKTNTSWEMSGLNLQNFIGNLYLPKINNNFLKKKIGKDKFSISRSMSSPLITDNTIILADDKGTIFNIDKRGKDRLNDQAGLKP